MRLTPFEEYMLEDDHPAYPMSCFFKIKLQGTFNLSVFASALQNAVKCHPFLANSVTEKYGEYHWIPNKADAGLPIERIPIDHTRQFPQAKGINLFQEPALKATVCNADTNPNETQLFGPTEIVFELHHSASDAIGFAKFLEDVFCHYAGVQRQMAEPSLLPQRSRPKKLPVYQALIRKIYSLRRAWKFLTYRVMPLTARKQAGLRTLQDDYPAILYRELSESETQSVFAKAKKLDITLNDLFLCASFLAIKELAVSLAIIPRDDTTRENTHLRIAVPTNLRTANEDLMPASNIVSMVFLDRKPIHIQPVSSFYRGVHNEMQHIKRNKLGWAFIHGLTIYRRIFGSFRKMMNPNRCWTTATVSNLGQLFTDIPLPKRNGNVQIDSSLELVGFEAAPPVRASTALGISIMTYADRLTISFHYDSAILSQSQANDTLETLCGEILCRQVLET